MSSNTYPAMLYRGAVLSPNPADQLIVHNVEDELAASARGYERGTRKPDIATAAGTTDPQVAAEAAFVAAATPQQDEATAAPVRRGPGRPPRNTPQAAA